MNLCYTGTSIPPLENSPCEGGIYYSTSCITTPSALTYLSLPINSSQTAINAAIIAQLIGKDLLIADLQNQINITVNSESIIVPLSDLITNLTIGNNKAYFTMPFAMNITSVKADVLVAQTSGSILTFDINENGTSVLSTKLTIDNNETSSLTATAPSIISDVNLAINSIITFDIDQIGVDGAKGATITLTGTRV